MTSSGIEVSTATTPSTEAEPVKPDMEGWLTKEGAIRKSWKKRWVVLTRSKVEYFVNVGDDEAKGSFDLTPDTVIRNSNRNEQPNLFEVELEDRTYFFSCASQHERDKWTIAFQFQVFIINLSWKSKVSQAISVGKDLVDRAERVLGREDDTTIAVIVGIGKAYLRTSNFADAQVQFEDALERMKVAVQNDGRDRTAEISSTQEYLDQCLAKTAGIRPGPNAPVTVDRNKWSASCSPTCLIQ